MNHPSGIRGSLHFEALKEERLTEIAAAFNRSYARQFNENYFRWKIFDPQAQAQFFQATSEGHLAGICGIELNELGPQGIKIGQIVHIFLEEKFRGKGLVKDFLARACAQSRERGFAALSVFTNINLAGVMAKMPDWKRVCTLSTMVLDRAPVGSGTVYECIPLEEGPVPAAVRLLIERSYNRGSWLWIKKDWDNFYWRFNRHPKYRYQLVTVADACCVIKLFCDPVTAKKFGDIVDYFAPENDVETLRQVFHAGAVELLARGCESVTTWALPHMPLRGVLAQLGFHESAQQREFWMHVLDSSRSSLLDEQQWRLVQADVCVY